MLPCRHTLPYRSPIQKQGLILLPVIPICPKHPRDISSQRQANAKPGRATPKSWPQAFRRKDGIRTASVAQSARAGFQASPCLGKSWQVLALISDSPSLTTEKGEFSRGTVCDGGIWRGSQVRGLCIVLFLFPPLALPVDFRVRR